ncbi:MAG TPA: hypothetical protein VGH72_32050, partial [Pseudonocardia sp.]
MHDGERPREPVPLRAVQHREEGRQVGLVLRPPCSRVTRPRCRSTAQPPATHQVAVTPDNRRATSAGLHGRHGRSSSPTGSPPGGTGGSGTEVVGQLGERVDHVVQLVAGAGFRGGP